MINYKELKVEHPRRYFSSPVVNEIDTILDGIEHALEPCSTCAFETNSVHMQDAIDKIRCLLYDYDEPLMNELNDLRAKNDSLEREVKYQKELFDKATKVIGLLALDAYDIIEEKEEN